ncbi:tRNA guanosine(34) transglycosylase Tgt [Candidatus Nomurabacteria bacterium RIFCSPHIGHO2_01_FULL_41_91]|uniref:Queuine tRNA-ribosyltransferase n=2 Tax=Candidatus Nomuraibacteriota TaxID=1752729 RepID=A0A1F6YD95_9BACT|nr:MAG: tRNA guanosine(34) transglycosylase Tgt [Candidatus Nomurabacteria bacterium RIFCSPHIGHO2_01_FULL_41_91]OGI80438.1 MAG: tRNA guanosine(34) transglycosylase Tgt [Candidatus Nomurabacteria bacterium RIFCSPHIGHO2_02_FULL_41_52]OGI85104.1 MAG: tRNA guanosine(34) transglycosylase Tgt [Candidatus Nomurabacteria bacterium RIFCSPHIGHO2_12_FULL_42_19]OGI94063.1 MAG: tRNA guanosine(34) transglycosylase Tgt [Candidatus Nomurabacteria bacterium RIFCSPLOWO2_01_FULL_41_52]OGI99588.1 MAG: tRNA guanosi
MHFKIEKKLENCLGRVGVITTAHGVIQTPAFVPVGTKASVKALTPEQARDLGAEVILANTYHLYLQPGDELVAKAGGLHKFMNWNSPIITDSGGFQVFSLGAAYGKQVSKITKITDSSLLIPERFDDSGAPRLAKIGQDGVSFKSHLDGSIHYITPEKSIQIQHNLGADIIFAFDECTSPAEDFRYQTEALERTHNWAKRSLEEHDKLNKKNNIALFGIVQGGRDETLRKKSANFLKSLDFDGFGIGGSFAKEDMQTAVRWVNEILPEEKPRHLLGIGEPEDLFMGIENGVDLFDCVAPTRNARNGSLYTKNGKINIMNAKYKNDFNAVEENCKCYLCANYSRAYLAHLFHGKEILAATLASIHNLYFIINLVKKIRQSILDDNFFEFKKEFLKGYLKS